MANLLLPLYSWGNGAFIMIAIFAIVMSGIRFIVAAVLVLKVKDQKDSK